jgi:predicted PurR-regulated permease PerM
MKQLLKYTGYVLVLALIGFLIWQFSYIIVWILIAAVLSFIGHPLVKFFDKLHIRKFRIPHSISAILALVVIVLFFIGLLAIFVPLIINEAETISKIDIDKLALNFQGPMQWINNKLHEFGAIPDGQTMQDFIVTKVKSVVNLGSIGKFLGGFISAAGNIFLGIFSILFIAFFFMKEENMFEDILLLIIPVKHHAATRKVITESKNLLMRYFIGVILEVLCVMSLITIGLWIFGIKNALLIGFFGGIMNIIPYLGPVIGSAIGISLGVTSTLAFGSYNELLPEIIKLAGVFIVVNFIDNNILVPTIYSKSVKSHPLEIFLIIIVGGGLAGLPGMLLAVPVYTLLRVIAKEFFQHFRVVKKLTETMNMDQQ